VLLGEAKKESASLYAGEPINDNRREHFDRWNGFLALPFVLLYPEFKATWRSGYAAVCKTAYSGSIPDVASKSAVEKCFSLTFR
jgi:hypothetical protein